MSGGRILSKKRSGYGRVPHLFHIERSGITNQGMSVPLLKILRILNWWSFRPSVGGYQNGETLLKGAPP